MDKLTRDELIEKVAQAIAEERFGGHCHWDAESDAWRSSHCDMARAAIDTYEELMLADGAYGTAARNRLLRGLHGGT